MRFFVLYGKALIIVMEKETNIRFLTDPDNLIRFIRNQWVLLDKDLADLYGVSTKVLNQQVKRNIERFPSNFMFKLNKDEFHELVTNCDRSNTLKHSSVMPNAFTEQGVSMLSAVLRSPAAIQVSIRIIESFVRLRKLALYNTSILQRLDIMENKQQEADKRIIEILKIIGHSQQIPSQGIFYNGQVYDAYSFVSDLIRSAEKQIILIDNYIDDTVLTLLDKRNDSAVATIYTSHIDKKLRLDIRKHNAQYKAISILSYSKAHDRFLIIDDNVYLIGASIKDLGKKWFGFTLIQGISANDICEKLQREA